LQRFSYDLFKIYLAVIGGTSVKTCPLWISANPRQAPKTHKDRVKINIRQVFFPFICGLVFIVREVIMAIKELSAADAKKYFNKSRTGTSSGNYTTGS